MNLLRSVWHLLNHEDFDRHMHGPRMASAIAAGIGVLTLALACLGIFGVVSYGAALRTKKIGIRWRSARNSRRSCDRLSGRC
jgi:hypothetical protein